jgi:hypothetical protein
MANDPRRRRRDEDDILTLLAGDMTKLWIVEPVTPAAYHPA